MRHAICSVLVAAVCAAGLSAGTATAANPTYPTSCGKAKPGSFFDVFVTKATTCSFGRATYRAVMAEQDRRGGFTAAVTVAFKVDVAFKGRTTTMSCRALARAHGVHDFVCNRGTGVKRVGVLLDDFS